MTASEGSSSGWEPGHLDPEARAELEALVAIFAEARAGSDSRGALLPTTIIPGVHEDATIEGFPWTDYHPLIDRFWDAVHRLGLGAEPFDWPAWLEEIRASGADPLDPELVASLSAPDLRGYLTALQRAERFTDGTWRAALESGVFEAILNRIRELEHDRR